MKTKSVASAKSAVRAHKGFSKEVFEKFYHEFAGKGAGKKFSAADYIRELRAK